MQKKNTNATSLLRVVKVDVVLLLLLVFGVVTSLEGSLEILLGSGSFFVDGRVGDGGLLLVSGSFSSGGLGSGCFGSRSFLSRRSGSLVTTSGGGSNGRIGVGGETDILKGETGGLENTFTTLASESDVLDHAGDGLGEGVVLGSNGCLEGLDLILGLLDSGGDLGLVVTLGLTAREEGFADGGNTILGRLDSLLCGFGVGAHSSVLGLVSLGDDGIKVFRGAVQALDDLDTGDKQSRVLERISDGADDTTQSSTVVLEVGDGLANITEDTALGDGSGESAGGESKGEERGAHCVNGKMKQKKSCFEEFEINEIEINKNLPEVER
jgi:hypothetical protein